MNHQLEGVWRQPVKARVSWKPSGRRQSSLPGPQPPSVHGMSEPSTRPDRHDSGRRDKKSSTWPT
ncbi:hypothetical protein DPMN_088050 [Dreissena polymorpha]|uniref:Uncharacterized protein n=1 Tax=Dreissena polymorpha TaxID=45954 RepID=A0A9D4QWY9_DREPO|nr:hypothetical protein DPMN_088050 [Dreissena polymorpha]